MSGHINDGTLRPLPDPQPWNGPSGPKAPVEPREELKKELKEGKILSEFKADVSKFTNFKRV